MFRRLEAPFGVHLGNYTLSQTERHTALERDRVREVLKEKVTAARTTPVGLVNPVQ